MGKTLVDFVEEENLCVEIQNSGVYTTKPARAIKKRIESRMHGEVSKKHWNYLKVFCVEFLP